MACVLGKFCRSHSQNLGCLGKHFCTLAQDISNWPEVVPMSLNYLQADADESYLPSQFEFIQVSDNYDLRDFK